MSRKRRFETPDDLIDKADEYFEWCIKNNDVPMMTGFARWLGIWSTRLYELKEIDKREAVHTDNPRPNKKTYEEALKHIKNRVAEELFKMTLKGKDYSGEKLFSPAGIFGLKANHGWQDQPENQNTGQISINVNLSLPTPGSVAEAKIVSGKPSELPETTDSDKDYD